MRRPYLGLLTPSSSRRSCAPHRFMSWDPSNGRSSRWGLACLLTPQAISWWTAGCEGIEEPEGRSEASDDDGDDGQVSRRQLDPVEVDRLRGLGAHHTTDLLDRRGGTEKTDGRTLGAGEMRGDNKRDSGADQAAEQTFAEALDKGRCPCIGLRRTKANFEKLASATRRYRMANVVEDPAITSAATTALINRGRRAATWPAMLKAAKSPSVALRA